MNKIGLTAEVARRFGRTAYAAHNTHNAFASDVATQILTRGKVGGFIIETVWTLGGRVANEPLNAKRADEVERQLRAAGCLTIHRRRGATNYHYVGLISPVPNVPSSLFFDEVAEKMRWVDGIVDATRLL